MSYKISRGNFKKTERCLNPGSRKPRRKCGVAAPSTSRLALALLIAAIAFGAAFAVAKAGTDDGGGGSGAAPKLDSKESSPSVPGVPAPAALPALRTAPKSTGGGGSSGGSGGSVAPTPSAPSPRPPAAVVAEAGRRRWRWRRRRDRPWRANRPTDLETRTALLDKGTTVGGYRIDGTLGEGGMGVVYRATQLSLNRSVALKILSADLGDDQDFRERFRREGLLQAAIDHPHIVTVYDTGETEHGLFLAMRMVRGPTLKDMILARELDPARTFGCCRRWPTRSTQRMTWG